MTDEAALPAGHSGGTLQPGDVVSLQCGSALMTVERVCDNGVADTVWFDGGDVRHAAFRPDELHAWERRVI